MCTNLGDKTLNYRDSMTIFRGTSVKLLNSLNHRDDKVLDEKSFVKKRAPEISINLKHVYGIEVGYI